MTRRVVRTEGAPRLVRPGDAARILGVHPNTIRNMVLDGRLTNRAPAGLKEIRLDPDELERIANA